jgi:hypothetical protein
MLFAIAASPFLKQISADVLVEGVARIITTKTLSHCARTVGSHSRYGLFLRELQFRWN